MWSRLAALARRDIIVERSQPYAWLARIAGLIVATSILFYFIKLVGRDTPSASPFLAPYCSDLFGFLLVGISAQGFAGGAVAQLTGRLRESMIVGVFESFLLTRASAFEIAFGFQIVPFAIQLGRIVGTIAVGVLVFGADFSRADWAAAGVVMMFGLVALAALGLLAAALFVVFRRADPLTWAIATAGTLLSGLLFPVEILPAALQVISYMLPLTHLLAGLRMSLLAGAPLEVVAPHLAALALFAALVAPMSVWLFGWSIKRALRRGDLNRY